MAADDTGNAMQASSAAAVAGLVTAALPPPGGDRKKLGWFFWVCAGWIALNIVLAIFANVLPLQNPNYQNYSSLNTGPSAAHWLGTDDLGRDILSRLIYGARVSLIVGFGAILIGLAIGGTLGMLSGYRRGRVDALINAGSYVLLAFPALVAVIAIVTFWGHQLWKITVIIGIFSAPLVFRIVRASTLSYATRDFVTAAVAMGANDRRVVTREILPNILPTVVSFSLIGVAVVIVLEGSLAFLGLSVPGPTASWGNMLNEGRTYLQQNAWLTLFPAMAMFSFLLALNLIGDRLRQHFDVSEVRL
jgi:peptide/nickel transport system permease protein